VIGLFACWGGQFGSPQTKAIWKMILSCLMWCILRDNDWSFEDRKRMVVELKVFFFNTLYHWKAAYNCFHISSFHDSFISYLFLFYFIFFRCFSCILGYALLRFNDFQLQIFWVSLDRTQNMIMQELSCFSQNNTINKQINKHRKELHYLNTTNAEKYNQHPHKPRRHKII
jgi:hypothetical protein